MAADNKNRLASFTAWKRGRCKLALLGQMGENTAGFAPKQTQVDVVIGLSPLLLLPFPGINCADKNRVWKTTR